MRLRIAHSPDADDAFMFWGLASGTVPSPGFEVEHVLSDIESLNLHARRGTYEVTALSFAAWPAVADRYALLPGGASFGDAYGPVLVRAPGRGAWDASPVAVPGDGTTASLLLRLYRPGVRTCVVPFDRIQDDVAAGRHPAGVLIHEGQLTYERDGLQRVEDLGRWWTDSTGLPVPLGGNVARRDLGIPTLRSVARLLEASVRAGLAHRPAALAHAHGFARGLDPSGTDRFVSMYVNERTLRYGARELEALDALYGRARDAGLLPSPPPFRADLAALEA